MSSISRAIAALWSAMISASSPHASRTLIVNDLHLSSGICQRLAGMSDHPTVEARDTSARTSLRLLAVLDVLFKHACARQAARAFFLRPACA